MTEPLTDDELIRSLMGENAKLKKDLEELTEAHQQVGDSCFELLEENAQLKLLVYPKEE